MITKTIFENGIAPSLFEREGWGELKLIKITAVQNNLQK
jgi:hypothetical protein